MRRRPELPRIGLAILKLCLEKDQEEAITGDFSEAAAKGAFWAEMARSSPALLNHAFAKITRRTPMRPVLGAALLLPSTLLVVAGLAQGLLGVSALNDVMEPVNFIFGPIPIAGGLLGALILNVPAFATVRFEDGSLIARLDLRNRLANVTISVAAFGLGAAIAAYAVNENLQIHLR